MTESRRTIGDSYDKSYTLSDSFCSLDSNYQKCGLKPPRGSAKFIVNNSGKKIELQISEKNSDEYNFQFNNIGLP